MSLWRNITDVTAPTAGGMRASIIKERRLAWIRMVATLLVALVLVLLASWLRFPASGPLSSPNHSVFDGSETAFHSMPSLIIKQRGEGDSFAVQEQVTLFDPTPMFLPTAMSSAQAEPREIMHAGALMFFGEEQSKSFFPDTSAHVEFPSAIKLPDSAPGWMSFFPVRNAYQGIGRRDNAEGEPLAQRFASIAVARAGDGQTVAKFALTGEPATAPPGSVDSLLPAVMEFMIKVAPDGLVGVPRVITSSGYSDRDDYFADYLAKVVWPGFRLEVGTYIVTIGP